MKIGPMTDVRTIRLTSFQTEEVAGLLGIVYDEIRAGEDRIVWGTLDGRALTILDRDEAIQELRYRAEWMLAEAGPADSARSGNAGARSLLSLMEKIT